LRAPVLPILSTLKWTATLPEFWCCRSDQELYTVLAFTPHLLLLVTHLGGLCQLASDLKNGVTGSMTDCGTIAVCEDPFVRKLVRDILTRRGYRVIGTDVEEALEMLRSGAEQLSLVITNNPGEFVDFSDTLPLLYMAAAPDESVAARFRTCRTLQKPFSTQNLVNTVGDLVADIALVS
jgi:hypothetical protein